MRFIWMLMVVVLGLGLLAGCSCQSGDSSQDEGEDPVPDTEDNTPGVQQTDPSGNSRQTEGDAARRRGESRRPIRFAAFMDEGKEEEAKPKLDIHRLRIRVVGCEICENSKARGMNLSQSHDAGTWIATGIQPVHAIRPERQVLAKPDTYTLLATADETTVATTLWRGGLCGSLVAVSLSN